jgi:hypothetical protein
VLRFVPLDPRGVVSRAGGLRMASPFGTTSWSTILAARSAPSEESRRALETLCQAYWYPVYAFVRRKGHDADEAHDLTQAYFRCPVHRRCQEVSVKPHDVDEAVEGR